MGRSRPPIRRAGGRSPGGRRPEPGLPSSAYQSYGFRAPLQTHYRQGTCDEVDCPAWLAGWTTTVPAGSELEGMVRRACAGLEDGVRRPFREVTEGERVTFVFEPGTTCFRANEHKVRLERESVFVVSDGDHRSRKLRHIYDRPDQWVDDFATHQDRISRRL